MLTRTQHCGLPSCDAGMLGYLKHGSANLVTGIDTINHACSSHLPSISHLQLRRQRCGTVRPSPEESRRARSCSGFAAYCQMGSTRMMPPSLPVLKPVSNQCASLKCPIPSPATTPTVIPAVHGSARPQAPVSGCNLRADKAGCRLRFFS